MKSLALWALAGLAIGFLVRGALYTLPLLSSAYSAGQSLGSKSGS